MSAEAAVAEALTHPPHPLTPPRVAATLPSGAPDWPRIRREAAEFAAGPYGLLLWQEARLVAAGFHPMSPWWLATLEDFYASQKRWLLALVGRGGGKSSGLTRVAATAIDTERRIPPGQTWIYPFVSVRKSDARNRLFEIQRILETAYGLRAMTEDGAVATNAKGEPKPLKVTSPEGTPTLPVVDSRGHSIAFVSFAATIGNVSGPNAIGATVDEEEKLSQDEEGKPARANPAGEIIGSLIATFRARPGIRGIRCSSAMGAKGSLYLSADAGHTVTNFVATLGTRWVDDARAGCLEVARWEEEAKRDAAAADALRRHALALTAESIMVPTWVANPMHGAPERAAVTYRIDVEGKPAASLEGLSHAGYFLREYCSRPMGLVEEDEGEEFEVCGEPSRYADEARERWDDS